MRAEIYGESVHDLDLHENDDDDDDESVNDDDHDDYGKDNAMTTKPKTSTIHKDVPVTPS